MTRRGIVAPRAGAVGVVDRLVGPGASAGEQAVAFGAGFIAAALVVAVAPPVWRWWQLVLAAVLAFDIVGGVAANATSAAVAWYHRPQRTDGAHILFVAGHALHVAAVGWAFRGGDLGWALVVIGYIVGAALVITKMPSRLRGSVALLAALTLIVGQTAVPPTVGMAWFLPALALKLLVAHLAPPAAHGGPAATAPSPPA